MYVLAFRLALGHLKRKPLSRLLVVFSVACILLMNGAVFMLFQSFSKSLAEIKAAQFMTVYIDSTVPVAREGDVVSAVKKVSGISSAQLVSKDSFLENFSKFFPQLSGELSALDSDTIPRYIKVKVDSPAASADTVVKAKLEKVSGVELVELNTHKFSGLISALTSLRRFSMALMFGMSLALLCVLLNHFKLGNAFQVQVRKTMSVLGARGGQVFLPFAIEGLVEGALGGAIAAGLLLAYGSVFEAQINSMFVAIGYHPYHLQFKSLALALFCAGTFSGVAGSLWATMRAKA